MKRLTLLFSLSLAGILPGEEHPWPDPVANDVYPKTSFPLTHGPVLGNITSDSVRVWIRCSEATDFEVIADTKVPFTGKAIRVEGATGPESDHTAHVQLDGLKANTRYFYAVRMRFDSDDKFSPPGQTGFVDPRLQHTDPWPSFRTLPDKATFAHEFNPEGKFNFSFSIGACQRQRSPVGNRGINTNPPAFDTLFTNHYGDLSFHVVNGDYTYEEVIDGTRAGLERNYRLYLDRGRSFQRFSQNVPIFTMFNDHEVTDNIDGSGEVGLGFGNYLVRDPALKVWEYYAGWSGDSPAHTGGVVLGKAKLEALNVLHDPSVNFSQLSLESISTLHLGTFYKGGKKPDAKDENLGVYKVEEILSDNRVRVSPHFRSPSDAEYDYSIGRHKYWDRLVGNCHFIFLDTRGERSKWKGVKHLADADRFILGEAQREWFLKTARESSAEFLFVISGDPWVILHSAYHMNGESTDSKGDGFAGYTHERKILLDALDAIEKPVLILTGDVHHPFAAQITDNVWEFLCSPINSANHPLGTAGLPPIGGWFDSSGTKVKIKWAGGYPDNVHYLGQRQSTYTVIDVQNILRAPVPEGSGLQYIVRDEPNVVVRFHDGYTGKLLYAEGISTLDAKPEDAAAPKVNRFGHWRK